MNDLPRLSDLERNFAREQAIDHGIIGVLLVVDAWMVVRVLATGNAGFLVLSVVLLGLSSFIHLTVLLQLFRKPGQRVRHLRLPEQVGRYSAGEIRRMVGELLAPHRGRELPAIYITESRYDGAAAVNSMFFNFLPPLNALYISRYLFRILKPGEIKAILAHELAHFHRYMRPLSRTRFALMVFNALLPLEFLRASPAVSVRVVLLAWVAFSGGFIFVLNWWLGRNSRTHEYLCDLQAARRYGILNVANSLLAVSKTAELQFTILSRLLREIRQDHTLSIQQLPVLFAEIDRALPDGVISVADIERAMEKSLSAPAVQRLRRPLSARKQKLETTQIDKLIEQLLMNREFALIDWREFDHTSADGRVDEPEYADFVRALENGKGRQLVAIPTDNEQEAATSTHPTLRERILFLEKCRREGAGLALGEVRK